MLIAGPEVLGARYRGLSNPRLTAMLAATRPTCTPVTAAEATPLCPARLGPPLPAALRAGRRSDRPPAKAPGRPRPSVDGRLRRRTAHRGPAADHCRRQPGPAALTGSLRRANRRVSDPRVLGQDQPAPTQPSRRSAGQLRALPRRPVQLRAPIVAIAQPRRRRSIAYRRAGRRPCRTALGRRAASHRCRWVRPMRRVRARTRASRRAALRSEPIGSLVVVRRGVETTCLSCCLVEVLSGLRRLPGVGPTT